MIKSTNKAIVVPLELTPHPNADRLSIVNVDKYTVVVNTDSWAGHTKAVFVPPENLVPIDREEFSFLKKDDGRDYVKVKPIKLRGVYSRGLLVPATETMVIGDDVTEHFGIKHQDDELIFEDKCEFEAGPRAFIGVTKYDVDAYLKYHELFIPGETLVVTEKIHGTNFKCVLCPDEQRFYVGSRTNWMKEVKNNLYWKIFNGCPQLAEFCKANPNILVRGEGYGMQKNYKYGRNSVDPGFVAFDVMTENWDYLNHLDACRILEQHNVPIVPLLGIVAYGETDLNNLSMGQSVLHEDTVREGCVIRPNIERQDMELGRVILKLINPDY